MNMDIYPAIVVFVLIAILHLIRALMGWDLTLNDIHIPSIYSFIISGVAALLAAMLWRVRVR